MSYRVTDNTDAYLNDLEGLLPKRKQHTLTHENNMEYASYLQDKRGYYVYSDAHIAQTVDRHLKQATDERDLSDRTIALALEASGFEEIDFLRSYTDQLRPPVRKGQPPRKAHPGAWADITANLKNAYRFRVNGKAWRGGAA